ncbi:caspase-7-like isoform X2 [Polypterus senegalus]|nr:caspase-7-like isoform X2 [Polypterus senegalus]
MFSNMPLLRKSMNSGTKKALIVSVGAFHKPDLPSRSGSKRDTKRLHKILTKLGFKVTLLNDLTAEEIYEEFQNASREPLGECFLTVISSHGEEGRVYGADCKPVKLADIFSFFDGPATKAIPKLFFVQACRGQNLDGGVEVDSAMTTEEEEEECSFSTYLSIPNESAVCFATAPGYAAFLNLTGSVFLQTLCDILEEENGCNLEVNQIATQINYRVAYHYQAKGQELTGKKEMPCFVSRLTLPTFPFAKSCKERSFPLAIEDCHSSTLHCSSSRKKSIS